jgi:hypothetical protein
VSNFLLYLRVSGLFHLVIGMLYLFGFRLPETHHRYFLASSFTDFWRRINIYWKNFMLKVFYYPAYFKLRRLGPTKAMVLATLFVFVMTWFLHAYQWFWLRGTALIVWQDVLFWTILGVLVVVDSLWEAKHGRERSLRKSSRSWRDVPTLTLKTVAMFCFMSILWSFWTSESVSGWMSLWVVAGERPSGDIGLLCAVPLAAVVLGGTGRGSSRKGDGSKQGQKKPFWLRPRVVTAASLVLLGLAGLQPVYTQLGPTLATIIHSLRSGRLSRLDSAMLERGYYEKLLSVDRFNSQLWEVYAKKPAKWLDVENAGLTRFNRGFAQSELIPSFVSATRYGTLTVNRWGMRDQDYEIQPGPNTYRIAMLGASTVMGWGVGDGETFEALLESRLNNERAEPSSKYEILNFGVPGYVPPQQLAALEKALAFHPNAVFYIASSHEISRAARYLVQVVQKKIEIPYDDLKQIVRKAGLEAKMNETVALRRLEPLQGEVLSRIYRHITEECRARGIVPVWIFLPHTREGTWKEVSETPAMLRTAEAEGFVIVNLTDVFEGHDIDTIRLAEWDQHPNTRGHQLIAAQIYEGLRSKQDLPFKTLKLTGR